MTTTRHRPDGLTKRCDCPRPPARGGLDGWERRAALGLAPPARRDPVRAARQWQDVIGAGGGDRNRGAPGDRQWAGDPLPVGGGE